MSEKKSMLPVVLAACVLTPLLTLGGVYFLMQNQPAATAERVEATVVVQAPIFVPIAPFTVNLDSATSRSRLLYVGLTFRTQDQATADFISQHLTQVKSRMLVMLSSEKAEDLTKSEGKKLLAGKIVESFQQPYVEHQPQLLVSEVLFTDFIVQ